MFNKENKNKEKFIFGSIHYISVYIYSRCNVYYNG